MTQKIYEARCINCGRLLMNCETDLAASLKCYPCNLVFRVVRNKNCVAIYEQLIEKKQNVNGKMPRTAV